MFKLILTSEVLDLPQADLYITGVSAYVWVWPMVALRAKLLAEQYPANPTEFTEQEPAPTPAFTSLATNPDELEALYKQLSISDSEEAKHNTLRYTPKSRKRFKEFDFDQNLKNKINKIIGGII